MYEESKLFCQGILLGAKFMSPSLLKSFSGMVCDGINKSIEGESHLSIVQMTGQIASTTVTPVNHSIKGKAVMQGMREGTQGLLGCRSVKQEESWIYYRGVIKSKVIHFNFLLEEGRGICFLGLGEEWAERNRSLLERSKRLTWPPWERKGHISLTPKAKAMNRLAVQ